jgi:hypothetical protein
MGVALSCPSLCVTEQLPDDWESETAAGTDRSIGMPKIVEPNAYKSGVP